MVSDSNRGKRVYQKEVGTPYTVQHLPDSGQILVTRVDKGWDGSCPTVPPLWETTVAAVLRIRSLYLSGTEVTYLIPHLAEGVHWEDVWATMQLLAQHAAQGLVATTGEGTKLYGVVWPPNALGTRLNIKVVPVRAPQVGIILVQNIFLPEHHENNLQGPGRRYLAVLRHPNTPMEYPVMLGGKEDLRKVLAECLQHSPGGTITWHPLGRMGAAAFKLFGRTIPKFANWG